MKVALVSPFPPAKSGIADYSAALRDALRRYTEVESVAEAGARFAGYPCYQIGNNGWHAFAYDLAMEQPGVVVLHEANLHHLMCDVTIRRGRWDLYLEEAEYNGGAPALEYARRVRALEVGPDYDGLPMTRRLLEKARGVIVHSRYVAREVRAQGYAGPLAVIPHGAWIPQVDRLEARDRLGLNESAPLIGIFGFLKPYKRIPEALRAFRRLLRLVPEARMLLGGEVHPEFALEELVAGLGLGSQVRITGHLGEERFVENIAACDIVLNLRFPTVGETSGTLLRSLGLGRAVLVSDIGSFSEMPDEVCLKVPVGRSEEDTLFEYLHLLAARPDLRAGLGERARAWVEETCSWDRVAREYAVFLDAVAAGRPWSDPLARNDEKEEAPAPAAEPVEVPRAYIASWGQDDDARAYMAQHADRFEQTLRMTPPGGPGQRVLEMGAYLHITPALKTRLGYEEVRGCYYGTLGVVDHKRITSAEGETFECFVDHFDAERDVFPYAGEWFDTVLCCELLEHLPGDPMHMMAEINRILKPEGRLLITTPNLASLRALAAVLQGYHPGFFPAYLRPSEDGTDARHNREYTAKEIWMLFWYAGFEVERLETGEFRDEPRPQHHWVQRMLKQYGLPQDLRGDGIYCLGRKTGPVRERYPGFLYS